MTALRRTHLAFVILVVIPGAGAQSDAELVRSFQSQVRALDAWRDAQHQALSRSGVATADAHRAIDQEYLGRSRALEPQRTRIVQQLEARSGVKGLGQGAFGTPPELGRGAVGDIDTRSLSGTEFKRVSRAAADMGLKVGGVGDARTIEGVDLTYHREGTPYRSPTGSSARATELGRGMNPETAISVGDRAPHVQVSDNLRKASATLGTAPEQLSTSDLQHMGKMTSRNLQAGMVDHPELANKCNLLKSGYSPEAAGVVRPNATSAQRAEDLAAFQRECVGANQEAVTRTQSMASKVESRLASRAQQSQAKFNAALASGDDAAIAQARSQLQSARNELVEFRQTRAIAAEGAARSSPEAAKLLAEANGAKVQISRTSSGARIITNAAGETVTPSQLRDAATRAPRAAVAEPAPPPEGVAPPGPGQRVLHGIGIVMLVYHAYKSLETGAQEAGEKAAETGEGSLTSAGRTAAYSLWNLTGIPQAIETGRRSGNESMSQYEKDVAEGAVDRNSWGSWAYAKLRGAVWGVSEFTGVTAIKDAVVEGTGATYDTLNTAWIESKIDEKELADVHERYQEHLADIQGEEQFAAGKALADAEDGEILSDPELDTAGVDPEEQESPGEEVEEEEGAEPDEDSAAAPSDESTEEGELSAEAIKILETVVPTPVTATGSEVVDAGGLEGETWTTTITVTFTNVGAIVPGHEAAVVHTTTTFASGAIEKETWKGTFSGGPNGIFHFSTDGEAFDFQLEGGRLIRTSSLTLQVKNPEAFATWPVK